MGYIAIPEEDYARLKGIENVAQGIVSGAEFVTRDTMLALTDLAPLQTALTPLPPQRYILDAYKEQPT